MKHLDAASLGPLLVSLKRSGHRVIGPLRRQGAVVLGEVAGEDGLPRGRAVEQEPGRHRTLAGRGDRYFPAGPSAQGWKRFLLPPETTSWTARRGPGGVALESTAVDDAPLALFGVRPCDAAAIERIDRALTRPPRQEPAFRRRRDRALVVVAQCTQAAPSCFCPSTGSGPRAVRGFDLALTEVLEQGRHYFLVETGSPAGAAAIDGLDLREASPGEREAAARLIERARRGVKRELEADDELRRLGRLTEHPRWDDVARRCLACGNCTAVCPTCFCTTFEDHTDFDGASTERRRAWDSCFSLDFSYVHGGPIRPSIRARYRHWLTHKLSGWFEQFGTSGCVGCGRCITWCPVGIDITEEVRQIVRPAGAGERLASGRTDR